MNVSPELLSRWLPYIKGTSIFLTLFLVGSAVYFAFRTATFGATLRRAQEVIQSQSYAKRRTVKAWNKIRKYLSANDETAWKLAVLEADILLDETLRVAGLSGKNLGERLKRVDRGMLSSIDDVWEAHKFRNLIAHEGGASLTPQEATRFLNIYERALRDFGLLD